MSYQAAYSVLLVALLHITECEIGADEKTQPALTPSKLRSQLVPTPKDVQSALNARTDKPRLRLLERLQRAGKDLEQAGTFEALVTALLDRWQHNPPDAIDLQFVAMLAASPQADPERLSNSFLSHPNSDVGFTLLLGWLDRGYVPPWRQIELLIHHPDFRIGYALPRAVITMAERSRTPEAGEFLIDTIEHADGQLQYAAAAAMTRMTGQSFGDSTTQWRQWWAANHAIFPAMELVASAANTTRLSIPWNSATPKFYNAPVIGRRILFVLDRSQSMASSVHGEERIERLHQEFEQAILKLPPQTEFNVYVYHDVVEGMSPSYVTATPENKRRAIAYALRVLPERKTACYDALHQGLLNHFELEAIYFLSDGEPTAGTIVDPVAIVDAITRENRHKQTSIYTLGIDARGLHQQFLQELASRNFGEYFLIR